MSGKTPYYSNKQNAEICTGVAPYIIEGIPVPPEPNDDNSMQATAIRNPDYPCLNDNTVRPKFRTMRSPVSPKTQEIQGIKDGPWGSIIKYNLVKDGSFEEPVLTSNWLAIGASLAPLPPSPEIDTTFLTRIAHTGNNAARLQPIFVPNPTDPTLPGTWQKAYLAQLIDLPVLPDSNCFCFSQLNFCAARYDRKNGANASNKFSLRTSALVFCGDVRTKIRNGTLNPDDAIATIAIMEGVPNDQVAAVPLTPPLDIKVVGYDFKSYYFLDSCCKYPSNNAKCSDISKLTLVFIAEEANNPNHVGDLFGGVWYIDDVFLS